MSNKVKNSLLGERPEYIVEGEILADGFRNRKTGKLVGSEDTYTKEQIDAMLAAIREGQYVEVNTTEYPTLEDFLESEGQQGTVYLYPVENEANNYYQYIWEVGQWKSLGSTEIDLSQYYTKTESDEKFVDLTSAQAISGIKTLLSALRFNDENFQIYKDGILLKIKVNGQDVLILGSSSSSFNSTLRPQVDNTRDLGQTTVRWRDLYLSGSIKDGTNEFNYSSLGFPVITAPSSTTLTADEVSRISKGAIILGNADNKFLGYEKIVFFPLGERSFGETGGFALCVNGFTPELRQYSINTSNVIFLQDYTFKRIRIGSVASFNGKNIPDFPIANTSLQVPVIGANGGALSWKNLFSPESVSISDGGTISDDTLKELIIGHYPITLNGYTGYYSCDDGTNYQYASTMYDASTNSIHYNVITINKSTWVVTFHTKNIAL